MRTSIILTTYNQPQALQKVLWAYARQSYRDFQLVIADDGSGGETARVVDQARTETGLDLLHVWHEDRGFRKTEILNRAIVASAGEYLIFSDGDCIPRKDFVAVHVRQAERRRFLSGGYLKLDAGTSKRITVDDVRAGRFADPEWLARQGWGGARARTRLTRAPWFARLLDALTPTAPTWNGHNASAWRSDLFAVNGFDTDMSYGGLDRALGERLENYGVRGKQIRYRAPCLHLHHERPYVDPAKVHQNREVRRLIRAERRVHARFGIAEMDRAGAPSHAGGQTAR